MRWKHKMSLLFVHVRADEVLLRDICRAPFNTFCCLLPLDVVKTKSFFEINDTFRFGSG